MYDASKKLCLDMSCDAKKGGNDAKNYPQDVFLTSFWSHTSIIYLYENKI